MARMINIHRVLQILQNSYEPQDVKTILGKLLTHPISEATQAKWKLEIECFLLMGCDHGVFQRVGNYFYHVNGIAERVLEKFESESETSFFLTDESDTDYYDESD